ncbi:MAG: nitroreductase family protein [Peptococcaceae bacterium]
MVRIDQNRCVGCGLCVKDCIAANIIVQNNKAVIQRPCLECGHCAAVCPQQAVSLEGYDMADMEPFAITLEPEELLRSIKSRRSIRRYQPRKIEAEKLQRLVQAGRYTATAKNTQSCRFVLVQEQLDTFKNMIWQQVQQAAETGTVPDGVPFYMTENYKRFMILRQQEPPVDYLFRNAPAVLFIAANTPVDAALTAQNIELMAIAQGLGALYNGFLNCTIGLDPTLKQWLGLEDKTSYVCMLLGYPDVHYTSTAPRKPADVVWR